MKNKFVSCLKLILTYMVAYYNSKEAYSALETYQNALQDHSNVRAEILIMLGIYEYRADCYELIEIMKMF